jgi:hypothetical protein
MTKLKKKTYHIELDAKRLEKATTGNSGRNIRNSTTRYRHVEKKLARFCDFLLTGPPRRLILRFQIRGTWKRQTVRVEELLGPTLFT